MQEAVLSAALDFVSGGLGSGTPNGDVRAARAPHPGGLLRVSIPYAA